jgi:predicted NBD/HSP70 family sugar kinase
MRLATEPVEHASDHPLPVLDSSCAKDSHFESPFMTERISGGVAHGPSQLEHVTVDAYNAELENEEGFIGDRASNRAFRAILDEWRERVKKLGEDPFGDTPTADISKKKLDKVLAEGDPEAAGVVQGVIEEFAGELATVVGRLRKLKVWRNTEQIVVGGGLRASRIGELAIGRASVLVKAAGHAVDLRPIRSHPDEAGLMGAVHLAPLWMLSGHDSILAVDIGGSNLRAGLVELNHHKNPDLKKVVVIESELWRYADEEKRPTREEAVERIGKMLEKLVRAADKQGTKLAPFVGIGCPGVIAADGSIERGGQNLPGKWESSRFNLPACIHDLLPTIGEHETVVFMHNDAVVQGLSEVPFMRDVEHWGVLTIGTGLGNAVFSARHGTKEKSKDKDEAKEKSKAKDKEKEKEEAKEKA